MTRDLYDDEPDRPWWHAQRCQCSGDMPGRCPGPAYCPMCERDEVEDEIEGEGA